MDEHEYCSIPCDESRESDVVKMLQYRTKERSRFAKDKIRQRLELVADKAQAVESLTIALRVPNVFTLAEIVDMVVNCRV